MDPSYVHDFRKRPEPCRIGAEQIGEFLKVSHHITRRVLTLQPRPGFVSGAPRAARTRKGYSAIPCSGADRIRKWPSPE